MKQHISARIRCPGESRDPHRNSLDVLCLSAGQQTARYLLFGSTSDLVRRVWEHKIKAVPGFTAQYGVDRLVWFERHDSLEAAIERERRIKGWKRIWKTQLIEKDNPHWIDRYLELSR